MQSWLNPRCVFVCVYDSEEAVGIKKEEALKQPFGAQHLRDITHAQTSPSIRRSINT
jgi:hypothetical protein